MIWDLGSLEGGASKEISLIVIPDGKGELQCCARVQFEHGQCVRTRLTQADLHVRLLGPTQVLLHDISKFQIEVANSGQLEATDVVVTNTLPAGLEFHNSNPAVTGEKNVLTWKTGPVAPGETKKLDIEAMATAVGSQLIKVELKDSTGPKAPATLKVEVGEPKLEMTLTGPHRRLLGRPATYQITVSNPGSAPTTSLEVWGALPPQMEFVSASLGGALTGQEVRWKLDSLAPGARQTLQVALRHPGQGRLSILGQRFRRSAATGQKRGHDPL